MFNRIRSIFLAVAALCLAASAHAQANFFDGTFNNSDWSLLTFGNGTVTASQVSSGGNPGAYRQITNQVNAAPGDLIIGIHLRSDWVYNPATQGAISSIDYSLDSILISGFGQGQGGTLVAEQNGTYYSAGYYITPETSWTPKSFTDLTATSFSDLVSPNDPQHPDFSASGSPISFGFSRSNETTGGAYTIVGGIDNLSIEIHSAAAPEASSLLILGIGLLVGGILLQWRQGWKQALVASDLN